MESLSKIAALSDVKTFWSDPERRPELVLFHDRLRQFEDFVERCRAALELMYKSMFPLNPVPFGLIALMKKFSFGKAINRCMRAQLRRRCRFGGTKDTKR